MNPGDSLPHDSYLACLLQGLTILFWKNEDGKYFLFVDHNLLQLLTSVFALQK